MYQSSPRDISYQYTKFQHFYSPIYPVNNGVDIDMNYLAQRAITSDKNSL